MKIPEKENYKNSELYAIRHSVAHCLAAVVLEFFPDAKLGVGPPIEDGLYYDFLLPRNLTPEDLEKIETRMKEFIGENHDFVGTKVSADEARKLFANQPFKLELIDQFEQEAREAGEELNLTTYQVGPFLDLCRGGHVKNTKKIKANAVKIMSVAGAYWRGDENREQLQRIYATAWEKQKDLEDYLWRLEEAEKRDHRKLGEELDIFTIAPEVGKGLPLWLPNGTIIKEELENWAKETERKWGYQRISTPHITKEDLFFKSGHLPYFAEDMYSPMEIEGEKYYLKPMNCPMHHVVYLSRKHSYKELPIRYAEYGTVYRYERSGQLFGLMRVRALTQNDAHIYCREDQAIEEFLRIMQLHEYYYKALGINEYHLVLSLRDPEKKEKYHDDDEMWEKAESITREAAEKSGIPFIEDVGGAAHYGPKVDFVIKSAIGREFSISTNQVDLYMPKRFGLTFTNNQGEEEYVVVQHRAPLGSHERFVGFLIEHFAGAFPTWLSPVQVRVLAVKEQVDDYAMRVRDELFEAGFRADWVEADEPLGNRIRKAKLEKIPYILVVGDEDVDANTAGVNPRGGDVRRGVPITQFVGDLQKEVDSKQLNPQ
jgi:threonyl-tRNA synthetase